MLTGLAIGFLTTICWAALFLTVLGREVDRHTALQNDQDQGDLTDR
jgi:hypothetical protein